MHFTVIIFSSCRFLIQYVHPGTIPLALIGLLGAFYVLMFLLKAGCTDPGFIPRARQDEAQYNQGLGEPGKQHHLYVRYNTQISIFCKLVICICIYMYLYCYFRSQYNQYWLCGWYSVQIQDRRNSGAAN